MTPLPARARALLAALLVAAAATPTRVQAAPVTECSSIGICYCMNSDFKPVVDAQVVKLRGLIAAERAKGKAVGYLSIPLSTLEERWRARGFVRIHRRHLVALRHIGELRLDAGAVSVLVGAEELQVSRRHARELRDLLMRRPAS